MEINYQEQACNTANFFLIAGHFLENMKSDGSENFDEKYSKQSRSKGRTISQEKREDGEDEVN